MLPSPSTSIYILSILIKTNSIQCSSHLCSLPLTSLLLDIPSITQNGQSQPAGRATGRPATQRACLNQQMGAACLHRYWEISEKEWHHGWARRQGSVAKLSLFMYSSFTKIFSNYVAGILWHEKWEAVQIKAWSISSWRWRDRAHTWSCSKFVRLCSLTLFSLISLLLNNNDEFVFGWSLVLE